MVNIPVKTSFCGLLVLRRQRIGIGCSFFSALFLEIASCLLIISMTYQSEKGEIGSCIDDPCYEEV